MKFIVSILLIFSMLLGNTVSIEAATRFWKVESIDTMKFSRDASRGAMTSDQIDAQIKAIADVGATHVAIDTPYDAEFLARLKMWVTSARKYHLKVWFRGNFSSWEGWFGYPKNLTRDEHFQLTRGFILNNAGLFEDGDIFTACPECENGAPGDPRFTGDVMGFRKFMIDEYHLTTDSFNSINKKVTTDYLSMNGDVAKLVMDPDTTKQLGGVATIDHYVSTPDKLNSGISDLAASSGGKVVLGEFGTPIPDITGNQDEDTQAKWIQQALGKLSANPSLIGLNYWVGIGGSTALWNPDGTPRKAVSVIKSYYAPHLLNGQVVDKNNRPIRNIKIGYLFSSVTTNSQGKFQIPYVDTNMQITVLGRGFDNQTLSISQILTKNGKITELRSKGSWLDSVNDFLNETIGGLSRSN